MSLSKGKKRPASSLITHFLTKTTSTVRPESFTESSRTDESVVDDESAISSPAKRTKHRTTGFNPDWKSQFPWLKEAEGGMRCDLCIKHQRRPKKLSIGSAPWVDLPCTWLELEAVRRHSKTECHQTAILLEANRQKAVHVGEATERATTLTQKAREAAFRNLYWLMKRELPHTTNYLPLNELCKLQGTSILNNLHQGDNNKGESQRFTHEAVLTIGRLVQQPLLADVKASPWYSVMIDETTDIAIISEMIVYVRYLKDGASKTDFLAVVPLPDGRADTITAALLQCLSDNGLPLARLCAFGSDGAKVMVGRNNGVAAQLRRRTPHLLNNHCVAHRLALAAGQAAKGVPYLPKFKDILGDLHRFYDKSPVHTHGLQSIQDLLNEPKLKLAEAKDVRWLSHDKATTTLRKCLPSIFTSLEREAEERNDSRAAGLAVFTQDHRFVMAVQMMCDVLPHLSSLSCAMQKRDAAYTTVKPLVAGTVAIVRGLADQPGEHYKAAEQRVEELNAAGHNIRLPTPDQIKNFHDKIYLPFLANIVENLEDRFPDLPIIEKFGVFAVCSDEELEGHGDKEVKELALHFNLAEDIAVANWQQVKATLKGTDKSADETMKWICSSLTTSHPELVKIAAIGLLLPTSTADCERGFSTLKRIKTSNRSRLSNKVLNALLTASLQGPAVEDFDFARAVKEWHKEQPRRT